MSIDPTHVLAIIQELDDTPDDELVDLNPELLQAIRNRLLNYQNEVHRTLERLSFLDRGRLN